jgi:predicted aconitase with swiveling domain
MGKVLKGKGYTDGIVEAEAIVSQKPFGFWQGIDTETGIVKDARHDLYGQSIQGKVFIYPYGRGSTANSGVFVDAIRNRMAPAALVNLKTEPMIIIGAVLAEECYQVKVPVLDQLDPDPIETVKSGDIVRVDGKAGTLEIVKQK